MNRRHPTHQRRCAWKPVGPGAGERERVDQPVEARASALQQIGCFGLDHEDRSRIQDQAHQAARDNQRDHERHEQLGQRGTTGARRLRAEPWSQRPPRSSSHEAHDARLCQEAWSTRTRRDGDRRDHHREGPRSPSNRRPRGARPSVARRPPGSRGRLAHPPIDPARRDSRHTRPRLDQRVPGLDVRPGPPSPGSRPLRAVVRSVTSTTPPSASDCRANTRPRAARAAPAPATARWCGVASIAYAAPKCQQRRHRHGEHRHERKADHGLDQGDAARTWIRPEVSDMLR